MQRIGRAFALALTTLALVVLLALTSRREVTPLDPSLSAVEIWQRAQQTQVDLQSYAATQTFARSYPDGRQIETSAFSLDRASGRAYLRGAGSRAGGPPPVATPFPNLPPEVQAQQQQVMAAFSATFGLAPGEQPAGIELYYDLSTMTAYARASGHPWNTLSDDLWQRFGFADEVKPYEAAPAPVDLALAGTTFIDGVPVYRLTWGSDIGRLESALIDGNYHVLETASRLATDSTSKSLRTVTLYSDFDRPLTFPTDLPR